MYFQINKEELDSIKQKTEGLTYRHIFLPCVLTSTPFSNQLSQAMSS
jgi:hypothetical protein